MTTKEPNSVVIYTDDWTQPNVAHNARVAFVVDDIPSTEPMRVRCLEIRGHAQAIDPPPEPGSELDGAIIRIHPERIISFGIDEDRDPHQLTAHNRTVTKAAEPPRGSRTRAAQPGSTEQLSGFGLS